jgi:hypothetical protein
LIGQQAPAARRRSASGTPIRLVLATAGALALLVVGLRGASPGSGTWPGLAAGPAVVVAASPEASAPGGDTRSPGEGPGLVGAPFLAIVGVVALGFLAAGGTLVYLRLTAGPERTDRPATDQARDQARDPRRDRRADRRD